MSENTDYIKDRLIQRCRAIVDDDKSSVAALDFVRKTLNDLGVSLDELDGVPTNSTPASANIPFPTATDDDLGISA